jgi:hypothetical protein
VQVAVIDWLQEALVLAYYWTQVARFVGLTPAEQVAVID